MPFKGQTGIGFTHAVAVVDNLDERASRIFQDNLYACGMGVNSIFDKFLNNRSRSLYHFASSNLVSNGIGQ